MAGAKEKLVTRSGKIAFMKVASEETFTRMQYFTSMAKNANPKEYARSYVDQDGEVSDVTGYAPSIGYSFDRYQGNKVHDEIISITDGELTGTDAVREILIVDMTSKGDAGDQYDALLRSYSVIPDAEGDNNDAYTYSGNFKSNGVQKKVKCTLDEEQMVATVAAAAA